MVASQRVVFFDLGDTLGSPRFNIAPVKFERFDIYPFTLRVLGELRSAGHRLGIISNTGDDVGTHVDAVLASAGIRDFFEPALRIYSKDVGLKKDSLAIFQLAAARAGLSATPSICIFVGEDSSERVLARAAGFDICPHPLLARQVIEGQALRYARISVPHDKTAAGWRAALVTMPLVPMHIDRDGGVLVLLSESALPDLMNQQFRVELLGDRGLPLDTDLFLLKDDAATQSGFLSTQGQAGTAFAIDQGRHVLGNLTEGLILALPQQRRLGEFHFLQTEHGHTLKLVPDPAILEEPRPALVAFAADATGQALPPPPLTIELRAALAQIDVAAISDRIGRYSGQEPPAAGAAVLQSRHISHPDNQRAVSSLAAEFASRGNGRLVVRLHRFTHRGAELHNVEAELPGASPELVLVTAHLDSTAAQSHGYNESRDPAPGADDDCSGVAAVLAIAEKFAALSASSAPTRTLRFVLFNAEEEGLVGSLAYARLQWAQRAPIVAVLQMDMIGYNRDPPRSWEVHLGAAAYPVAESSSLPLAQLIADAASDIAPLLTPPQVYQTSSSGPDPADTRSDHSSFHRFGFPACCASEDLFAGPSPTAPPAEGNPNYHRREDTFVDPAYAADIARTIAAASWQAAGGAIAHTMRVSESRSRQQLEQLEIVPMTTEIPMSTDVKRDAAGKVRDLSHVQQPYRPATTARATEAMSDAAAILTPRTLAEQYLRDMAPVLELAPPMLENFAANAANAPTTSGTELRFKEEKTVSSSVAVSYDQTHLGLPIWDAGVAVRIDGKAMQVMG
jgi:leucyl aminopeptidase